MCEVESVMKVLQIAVPPSQKRDVMKEEDRRPNYETKRHIRDWGILIKYKNYLRCWRKRLLNMKKQPKKVKGPYQKPKKT